MKFREVKAVFSTHEISLAEELISDIFFSCGVKGVVCNIPLTEPDEGFGTQTLVPPDEYSIVGYVPCNDTGALLFAEVKRRLAGLSEFNINIHVDTVTVDESDWENAWKEFFHVTHITPDIVIKPEWRDYTPSPGDRVIHLDPGMAFGTGTHPSTAMCIRLMDRHITPGMRFLDVGTGSGILMITAALLGASYLKGIDNDETAVFVARTNLDKNRVDSKATDLAFTTLNTLPPDPYHCIAANIIAQVILDILEDIKKRLAPGGVAILSGIVTDHEQEIIERLQTLDFEVAERLTQEEWVALAVRVKTHAEG
ncbi:MAG: 50S ribosomal protein L11 methyltransferase [Desulfobacteraceae bacterium]|nr:MAG: 50S ribosomal protein L11 methyltransferase [Desulfobacteraceae bacterium]